MLENLDDFFGVDDFAQACVINTTPQRTINVIFSTPTEAVAMYDGSVEAGAKFLRCKTADVAGVSSRNTATIAGKVYKIRTIHDDGAGTSRVELKS